MSTPVSSRTLVLLGAQRLKPRLKEVVSTLELSGPFALITAGWQERESEDEELIEHLDAECVNLRLHERAETVFQSDPEFGAAHRARQDLLRHLQDVYRIRLEHAFAAELDVRTYAAPEGIREETDQASIDAIRALDNGHLDHCASIWDEFEAEWRPSERSSVVEQREQIGEALAPCRTVCIAGGHVAVLMNRLAMFGLEALVEDRAVMAWSAGAMAMTERVVLFHDDAPQGLIAREVLDAGWGWAPGVVLFPEPERRLHLTRADRSALLARRFTPARCVVLPSGAFLVRQHDAWTHADGLEGLQLGGGHHPLTLEEVSVSI